MREKRFVEEVTRIVFVVENVKKKFSCQMSDKESE